MVKIINGNSIIRLQYNPDSYVFSGVYPFYPYFIIGNKESNFSIDLIADGYFNDDNIVKLFSSVILVPFTKGPHQNIYNSVHDFFNHDVLHVWEQIMSLTNMFDKNIFDTHKNFYLGCRKNGIGSFVHRFVAYAYFAAIHENVYWTFFDNGYTKSVYEFIQEMPEIFDIDTNPEDTKYCLKWIKRSYDFNDVLKSDGITENLYFFA